MEVQSKEKTANILEFQHRAMARSTAQDVNHFLGLGLGVRLTHKIGEARGGQICVTSEIKRNRSSLLYCH